MNTTTAPLRDAQMATTPQDNWWDEQATIDGMHGAILTFLNPYHLQFAPGTLQHATRRQKHQPLRCRIGWHARSPWQLEDSQEIYESRVCQRCRLVQVRHARQRN